MENEGLVPTFAGCLPAPESRKPFPWRSWDLGRLAEYHVKVLSKSIGSYFPKYLQDPIEHGTLYQSKQKRNGSIPHLLCVYLGVRSATRQIAIENGL